MDWLANNIGTIIVIGVLAAIVLAISLSLIRDRKQGKSSCGCNCAHCAMAGQCHKSSNHGKEPGKFSLEGKTIPSGARVIPFSGKELQPLKHS